MLCPEYKKHILVDMYFPDETATIELFGEVGIKNRPTFARAIKNLSVFEFQYKYYLNINTNTSFNRKR